MEVTYEGAPEGQGLIEQPKPVEIKVALCLCSGEMIWSDTHDTIIGLMWSCWKAGISMIHQHTKSSSIANGRAMAVEQALKNGATHIFFIDSDMVLPFNTIQRLLSHNLHIVGATYARREYPFHVMGVTHDNKSIEVDTGLYEMARLPAGCLLIKAEVFAALDHWFAMEPVLGTQRCGGEDYYFCEAARAKGFKVWCDVDLSKVVEHIGQRRVKVSDYVKPTE